MSQKVTYVLKSEYMFVDKTCTKFSTRIDSPVQLCVQVCTGKGAPNKRWTGDNVTCNQYGSCGEQKNV